MASELLHLFFLLLLPFSVVIAQSNGNISIGSSLTAGDKDAFWLSASKDFAFGFQQLPNDQNHFLLSIWYYKVPENTIVWSANGDKPAPRQSKLELSADHGLILKDPEANTELWSSQIPTTSKVAYALMNNTGNFLLLNRSSLALWESFNLPTDTLLPTQIMEIGGVLSSKLRDNNFAKGRFQFRLLGNGFAVLNSINVPTQYPYDSYWTAPPIDAVNESDPVYRVVFDALGYLYLLKRNGEQWNITSSQEVPSATSYYHRLNLNFDGVLTLSYYPKNPSTNESWSVARNIPINICISISIELGTGSCGYNSICTLNEDGRPTCKCPPGYSLFDPSDVYSGCKPDFYLGCGHNSQGDFMKTIPNVDWPMNDYELYQPYNVEDCENACLQDCLCAAAIYWNNSCWKKKLPLSNGREDRSLRAKAFIKQRNVPAVGNPNSTTSNKKNRNTLVIIMAAFLGSSVLFNFILLGGLCLGLFMFYKKQLSMGNRAKESSQLQRNLHLFSYKELREATDGFKEELGRGSCGIVYKGEIDFGQVAVKKLDRVFEDNEKEFKAEVNVIGQTHHKNLVKLIGYCDENQHRLLVYEFLRNGTLASFLFGDLKPSWNQRTCIAYGVARGLEYLHEECSTQIIHCDIKPQNILLDEYYNARISDFGLAKLLQINQSNTKTNIRGTKGYVAPDWFRSAPISVKVDVYSFGVLLLEIICCRKNVEVDAGEEAILTDWASDCYQCGRLDALVKNDTEVMSDMKQLERFVTVAIWCLQDDPAIRPTMKKVMLMLEGIVQVSPPLIPSFL